MLPVYRKLPEEYREGYFAKTTLFIKNRVNLFCLLSIGLYIFASVAGALLEPEAFRPEEILMEIGRAHV